MRLPRLLNRVPLTGLVASLLVVLPTLAASPTQLRAVLRGNDLELSWDAAEPGSTYTVQSARAVAGAPWDPLGGAGAWPITGTHWTGPRPAEAISFFRLQITPPPAPPRGGVRSSVLIKTYSVQEMQALLQSYFQPAAGALAVEAWKLVYDTVDAQGKATQASTLVTLPVGATKPVPFASYQHGTVTLREDVPSRLKNQEGSLGLLLATSGYLGVLPDYLGLGDSPGLHPYLHAKSEATSVVDALRAAREHVAARPTGAQWNSQLFLLGYSQGGHATLAAQREIQLLHGAEFTVTACAPGAGPYDLSGTGLADFLSTRQPPNPYYSAYLMKTLAEVYDPAVGFAARLQAPYATTLPPLFDGMHDSSTINAAMPKRPADILVPSELADFTNLPDDPLRVGLRDNDLHTGWVPQAPLRLYHCAGDQDVLAANSDIAFQTFKAAGAPSVERIDPLPFADHSTCAAFVLIQAKGWFDGLKR